MSVLQEILHSVRDLSAAERVQLMEALWDSVSPEDWPPPSQAWLSEVRRRSKLLKEGRMSVAPWAEVRERSRRKAGLDD